MSLDIETIKNININWYIHYNPTDIIKDEENKIILNDSDTANIKFPLNDNYKYFVNKIIKGPLNVKQLLTIIYKFYQESLEKNM